MKKVLWIFTFVLVFVILGGAFAYANMAPPPITNTDTLKVGTWAKIKEIANGKEMVMWFGVVGEEKINGKRYVWIEIRTTQGGKKIIVKALMRMSTENIESDIKRIIIKAGNQPAMEISSDMMQMMGQNMNVFGSSVSSEDTNKANTEVKVVGTERVTVPAGTFTAKHIKIIDKSTSSSMVDIWQTNKVPISIVKVKSSDGAEMVLLSYGKGAKTEITEKPMQLNMQNIMNMNKK